RTASCTSMSGSWAWIRSAWRAVSLWMSATEASGFTLAPSEALQKVVRDSAARTAERHDVHRDGDGSAEPCDCPVLLLSREKGPEHEQHRPHRARDQQQDALKLRRVDVAVADEGHRRLALDAALVLGCPGNGALHRSAARDAAAQREREVVGALPRRLQRAAVKLHELADRLVDPFEWDPIFHQLDRLCHSPLLSHCVRSSLASAIRRLISGRGSGRASRDSRFTTPARATRSSA